MRLVRLAIVSLAPQLKDLPDPFVLQHDDVRLEVHPVREQPERNLTAFIAKAFVGIATPEVATDGTISAPEAPRQACEAAIVLAGDLLAISTRRSRNVISRTPSVALLPDDAAACGLLKRKPQRGPRRLAARRSLDKFQSLRSGARHDPERTGQRFQTARGRIGYSTSAIRKS